jgi:hypothetical protein
MNDRYMEAVKEAQRMRDDGSIGGVGKLGYAAPVDRDPDSVEQLLSQVFSATIDIKDAIGSLRHTYLGPWPEPATEKSKPLPPQGLIPTMKDTLYTMMEMQREIREHIAVISKGVR